MDARPSPRYLLAWGSTPAALVKRSPITKESLRRLSPPCEDMLSAKEDSAYVSDALWGYRYTGADRLSRGRGRSVVRGALLAPADNGMHGRRGGVHRGPKDLRPGILPYLLSKP